jgi:hypothetical protein
LCELAGDAAQRQSADVSGSVVRPRPELGLGWVGTGFVVVAARGKDQRYASTAAIIFRFTQKKQPTVASWEGRVEFESRKHVDQDQESDDGSRNKSIGTKELAEKFVSYRGEKSVAGHFTGA